MFLAFTPGGTSWLDYYAHVCLLQSGVNVSFNPVAPVSVLDNAAVAGETDSTHRQFGTSKFIVACS